MRVFTRPRVPTNALFPSPTPLIWQDEEKSWMLVQCTAAKRGVTHHNSPSSLPWLFLLLCRTTVTYIHRDRPPLCLCVTRLPEFVISVILRPAYFSHFLPNAPCRYGEDNTFRIRPSPERALSAAPSLLKSDSVKNGKIKGGKSHFLIEKASILVAGIPVGCH